MICRLSRVSILVLAMLGAGGACVASADKKYGPGVTDIEILVGQTVPYSWRPPSRENEEPCSNGQCWEERNDRHFSSCCQ